MNERIKELAKQAGAHFSRHTLTSYPVQYRESVELCDDRIEKFAELIIRDFISTCDQLANEAAGNQDDSLSGLVGTGWYNGWIGCAERLPEIVATKYNINHESFMQYDPKKSFFRS